MKALIGLAILIVTSADAARAEDWPQWRGPNRDGVSTAKLNARWPSTLSAPLWKATIGGGYSSPVISGGRVYVMGSDAGSKETCLCFDAQTGKPLWKHSYATDYVAPDPRAGNWPKSTPTVDRDRVYMLGLGGMFTCLDATSGRLLWSRDFRREFWGVEKDEEGVDKWFPPCGNAASPLVDGGTVIVPVGGKKAGALAGFDRKTGATVWTALPERSSYGSPLFAQLAGIRQLVGFTGLRMVSLDPASHKLLWDLPFPAMFEQTITTPCIWKDLVIVTGEQKPAIALRITKDGDKLKSAQAWQNPDLKAYLTSPVIFGDSLVGADSASKSLICVDLATGSTRWASPKIAGYVVLMVVGDRLLAQTSKGEMILAKADSHSYQELSRWKLSDVGETWAHPALADGRLYVKDKESLLCYDLSAGS